MEVWFAWRHGKRLRQALNRRTEHSAVAKQTSGPLRKGLVMAGFFGRLVAPRAAQVATTATKNTGTNVAGLAAQKAGQAMSPASARMTSAPQQRISMQAISGRNDARLNGLGQEISGGSPLFTSKAPPVKPAEIGTQGLSQSMGGIEAIHDVFAKSQQQQMVMQAASIEAQVKNAAMDAVSKAIEGLVQSMKTASKGIKDSVGQ